MIYFDQVRGDPVEGTPSSDIKVHWITQLVAQLMAGGWTVNRFTSDGYREHRDSPADAGLGYGGRGVLPRPRHCGLRHASRTWSTDGRVTAPWHPKLYEEITRLLKITPNKINHPEPHGSKDMADAWAGSVVGALASSGQVAWDSWVGDADVESESQQSYESEAAFEGAMAPMSALESRFHDAR